MSLFGCSCCDKTQKFRRKKGSYRKKSLIELLCCIRSQTGGIGAFSFRNNDITDETDPNLRYSERPVKIQWNSPNSDAEQPLLPLEQQTRSSQETQRENESDDYSKKSKKSSSFISYIRSNRSYNRTKVVSKDYF